MIYFGNFLNFVTRYLTEVSNQRHAISSISTSSKHHISYAYLSNVKRSSTKARRNLCRHDIVIEEDTWRSDWIYIVKSVSVEGLAIYNLFICVGHLVTSPHALLFSAKRSKCRITFRVIRVQVILELRQETTKI